MEDQVSVVPIPKDVGTPMVVAYADSEGGLLAVEYPSEGLTPDFAAAVIGNIIKDTLGPEPALPQVLAMQKTLMATLQGGESEGARTK